MNILPSLKAGDRVRLVCDVERFPFGVVEAGAFGTVLDNDEYCLTVSLDENVDFLDEWNNCLCITDDERDFATEMFRHELNMEED